MTRHWHCPACEVEWRTTDPTCFACGGQGQAGPVPAPAPTKSPSEQAAERGWRFPAGLGSTVPVAPSG